MPTQSFTFACPHCDQRMGVRGATLGKRVRCPHCRKVSVAPADAEPDQDDANSSEPKSDKRVVVVKPAVFPSPSTVGAPPPAAPAEQEYVFRKRETSDSILDDSDESEDDVFGSHGGSRVSVIRPAELPADTTGVPLAPYPVQPPAPAGFHSPYPHPHMAAPAPAPPANTWTALEPTAAPQPQPVPVPAPPAPLPLDELPPESTGVPVAAFYVLAAYSLLMTVLAVYGLFFK